MKAAASKATKAPAPSPTAPYTGTCVPTFPPPAGIDITKPASVAQYREKLEDDAIRARLLPLHVGWTFEAEIEPHARARDPPPGCRRVPPPLRLSQKKTFKFELHHALQPDNPAEDSQWSQVWVAALTDSEITDAIEPVGVVLKIIQPSLLPLPRYDDETLRKYRFPEHVANTEHVVYQHGLADVQGKAVPYYFGKTKVLMPNGEEADVLIFEAISGETVKSWVDRFELAASTKDAADSMMAQLPKLANAIAKSYGLLRDHCVLQRDVSLDNMIFTPGRNVIIVDFGDGCLQVPKSALSDEREGWHAGAFVIGHCRIAYPSFKAWAANEGKAMIAQYHMEGWDNE